MARGLAFWRSPAPSLSVEQVVATAPLGYRHLAIDNLLSRTVDPSDDRRAPELERLLDADVVALFSWKERDSYRVFDGWGRCLAVVPRRAVDIGTPSAKKAAHVVDSEGYRFSVQPYNSQITNVFSGATGAEVRFPPSHELVGVCDSRKGLLDPVTREETARWVRPERRSPQSVLTARDGAPIATRLPISGSLPRKTGMDRASTPIVLSFEPTVSPTVRATLIAREMCADIQRQKDANVG